MTDFLLELRSEEIPARMQAKAREDLARLFTAQLAAAGVAAPAITTYATPRRLTLIAHDVPMQTAAVAEEIKGPKTSAPPQALEGFLRKTGLAREQLVERDGVLFAVLDKPGRAMADVLAEAIPAIVRAFPWPKSMRWGDASLSTESLKWVRPLQGIVALLGDDVVPCAIAGIASGRDTVGHRFHSSGPIGIASAATYAEQLRDAHVIVDQDERAQIIALGATMAARKAGLELIKDEGLLIENAGLTEWPVPLLGRFDEAFLDVPPEVIQLTARVNQKYFVCQSPSRLREGLGEGLSEGAGTDPTSPPPTPPAGGRGVLANAFVCTANIDAADGGAKIVDGNRKVLAARLSDAAHFFEEDQWHHDPVTRSRTDRRTLDEHRLRLADVVFHEKLGTVADKVDRVAKLARWLVEEGIIKSSPSLLGEGDHAQHGGGAASTSAAPAARPLHPQPAAGGPPPRDKLGEELADLAERAARLCKADLVTGMVGEFPELQGLMGGYYAAAQGEDPRVAAAIRDHYKPVGQGDDVPTDPVTVAVSLADKLDTIAGFFLRRMLPSGSKDPFALRRASISVLATLVDQHIRLPLHKVIGRTIAQIIASDTVSAERATNDAYEAFVQLGREGVRANNEAVNARLSEMRESPEAVRRDFIEPFMATFPLILDFFADRLKVQQREAGVRHDLIDAVFALGGEDDLVRLLARVHALQAFIGTEDGANLLAGYKRAANILKKEGVAFTAASAPAKAGAQESPGTSLEVLDPRVRGGTDVAGEDLLNSAPAKAGAQESPGTSPEVLDPRMRGGTDVAGEELLTSAPAKAGAQESPGTSPEALDPRVRGGTEGAVASDLPYTPEPAEAALIAALGAAAPAAADAIAHEDFEAAMAALATLRAPIDAFFESVIVNDPDPAKRAARLELLEKIRNAIHSVADFSKIEG